jgi:hypothetical protein
MALSPGQTLGETLPQLARHYHREALKELEDSCPWLKLMTSMQPDLSQVRDLFFKDGSTLIIALENHAQLVHLAAINEALTVSLGTRYIAVIAPILQGTADWTFPKDTATKSHHWIPHFDMPQRLNETIDPDSLKDLQETADQIRLECQARRFDDK